MKNRCEVRKFLGWWWVYRPRTLIGRRLLAIFRYQEDAEFFSTWIDITIYASRGYSKIGKDRNINIRTDGVRQWDGNTGKDLGPAQRPTQFFFNMRSNDAHLYRGRTGS